MADLLSQEEIELIKVHGLEEDDYFVIKDKFSSFSSIGKGTLKSILNESSVSFSSPKISFVHPEEISEEYKNVLIRLELKSGFRGYAFVNLDINKCKTLAASMVGLSPDDELLTEETILSAANEIGNQLSGKITVNLSRMVDATVDISTPDTYIDDDIDIPSLFRVIQKKSKTLMKIAYTAKLNDEFLLDFFLVFDIAEIKAAAFNIKNTESKNLLRSNPELTKTIAEYFTLLASKYKSTYSMIGILDNVSVQELNSIHSLQCLDVNVINNYSIINKNIKDNVYNVYIFEDSFVDNIKKELGMSDDENDTWDVLQELNNQFTYIFLEYCSDSSLMFNDKECNNFLELPDSKYLLVSFNVGVYRFYQLLSFSILDKIKSELVEKESTFSVDISSFVPENIEKSKKSKYNAENQLQVTDSISEIPEVFRNLPISVSAVIGEKVFSIKEILHFTQGYIIHFNKKVTENIDIFIDSKKKAEGEVGQLTFNKSNNYAVKLKKFKKE